MFLGNANFVKNNFEGIVEKVKGRLDKWKYLLPKMSYKGRILIVNNLVASALWHHLICIDQGCPNSVLEGRCPAEFSSNLPHHTCKEASSMPSKSLISFFRCAWLGLELNSAGHRPSRTVSGQPWYRPSSWCISKNPFNLNWLLLG